VLVGGTIFSVTTREDEDYVESVRTEGQREVPDTLFQLKRVLEDTFPEAIRILTKR
jgi:hypothetical protein